MRLNVITDNDKRSLETRFSEVLYFVLLSPVHLGRHALSFSTALHGRCILKMRKFENERTLSRSPALVCTVKLGCFPAIISAV